MQKGPALETESFDALTRQFSAAGSSRRVLTCTLAGALLGGAMAGVAARFGLAEPAAAKPKHHKAKHMAKHKPHAKHTSRSQAHAEGKHKGKKRHKSPAAPPPPLSPLPPGCENCTECQMCQNGACVADPALAGVPCQGSGATCSHCLLGVCTANEQLPCDDGFCVRRGQCCSGEQYCSDPESSTGFSCIGPTDCCPGRKKCGSACVSISACCPGEKSCGDGSCVADSACCPGEHRCGEECLPESQCCPDQQRCGLDCIPANQCCDDLTPDCGPYGEPVCKQAADAAYWDCKPVPHCPDGWQLCPGEPTIYGGCCDPSAYVVHSDGRDFCLMLGFTPCHP